MSCPCEKLAAADTPLSPVCIGHLWMFRELAESELELLAGSAVRRQRQKGGYVFCQGDRTEELFLLKSGRVRLVKYLDSGGEITLDIRKAGDFIGENMLSAEAFYPVTAVCMENTLTCGFSKKQFEEIIMRFPNIGLQVIRNMSECISQLTSRVGSMASTTIEEKLHSVLLNIASQHGRTTSAGLAIDFPLTHEELGFLIGAHRVSVTRAMKNLKDQGRVRENGRRLVVSESSP